MLLMHSLQTANTESPNNIVADESKVLPGIWQLQGVDVTDSKTNDNAT